MKTKLLFHVLFLSVSLNSFSQESKKTREVSLSFYNFNNYGVSYKVGKENKFWRFRALNGGLKYNHNYKPATINPIKKYSYFGFLTTSAGRERRKLISPKINLVYGFELLINYTYEQTGSIDHYLGGGIVGVLGIRYDINERFFTAVELLPSVTYNEHSYILQDDVSFGFGNNSALLSFGIKF